MTQVKQDSYGSFDHEQELIEWEADMERNDRWYEGDARRCQHHPDVKTSSDDGMFDGLCWKCESAMDEDAQWDGFPVEPGETIVADKADRKKVMLDLMVRGWKVRAVGTKVIWERKASSYTPASVEREHEAWAKRK